MKTPHEVLLERHQAILPKLDAIRQRVLEGELRVSAPPHRLPWRWLSVSCRELVWPCRRVWAGLAVVWLCILAAQISLGDHSQSAARRSSEPPAAMMLALWRQEWLLSELIEPRPPRMVAPPKPVLPQPRSQPRSQRRAEFLPA